MYQDNNMDLSLSRLLFRASHGKNKIMQPIREELGLGRGQPRILTYLSQHGASTQNDIAAYLDIDPAAVSRMTEILRKNGFLTRTADEECRRSNRLELTDKGRKAVEIWESEIMIVEKRLLSGFSDDEARLLKEYLVRLIENMQGARNE